MQRDWEAWGQRLKRLRVQRGLTQQALADKAEVARNTIARFETATRRPDIDVLERLARALRLSIDEVLGRG
jgi:transcriptional regulator with XRE-family HTH domain